MTNITQYIHFNRMSRINYYFEFSHKKRGVVKHNNEGCLEERNIQLLASSQ